MSTPDTTQQQQTNEKSKPEASTPPAPPQEGGVARDKFGYELPADQQPKPPAPKEPGTSGYKEEVTATDDKKPDDKKPDEKKDIPNNSGYGAEPPKDEKPTEEKKPEEKKPDEKPADESFKVKEKGDLSEQEVKHIEDFVAKHKLPKEVAEALVDSKKAEIKAWKDEVMKGEQAMKEAKIKVHQTWHKELFNDPKFGGGDKTKFAEAVHQVDKVIEQFFPDMKKMLTEKKEVLPPYIMKDLRGLAAHLFSSGSLVHGEPTVEKDETKPRKPWDYYE